MLNEQEDLSPYLYLVNQRHERVGKLTDFHEKAWEEEKILNEILDKTIKSKLEAVEGEITYANECDKLDEVDEQTRITNLLNENMVVGYNCAVEDFKNLINKHK
jgi:hypothetical protein